jgi:hypothetical protein
VHNAHVEAGAQSGILSCAVSRLLVSSGDDRKAANSSIVDKTPPAASKGEPARAHFRSPAEEQHEQYALEQLAEEHEIGFETVRLLRIKFLLYDLDNTNSISRREFGALVFDLSFRLGRRRIGSLADLLDVDQSGAISFDELVLWFAQMVKEQAYREAKRTVGLRGKINAFTTRFSPSRRVKLALAWVTMWAILAMTLVLSLAYARSLGSDQTRAMLMSWGLAELQALGVEEPLIIAITVLAPSGYRAFTERLGPTGILLNESLAHAAGWLIGV